ncbi:MAG: DUF1993 domain-containing protein [Pseudoxanthomonas sp.]
MTISMHAASVPVFQQLLGSLDQLLAKAESHATEHKIQPDALLQARLYPNMFPLAKQVQIACDFARGVSGRLAGVELPVFEGEPATFTDLRGLVAATLDFIGELDAQAFQAAGTREIVLRPGTPKERKLEGQPYLLHYGLPQFFFHVTTAYDLLRHNGVEVGKRDYMGAY